MLFRSSNVLLPIGALLTCVLIGWRLPRRVGDEELTEETTAARRLILLLLKYVCPIAITAVLIAAFI